MKSVNNPKEQGSSNERRTAQRRAILEQHFEKKASQLKKMWALYNKYVRQRKDTKAQEQKKLVFGELSAFLLSMYDEGCLVYIEDHELF